MNTVPNNVVLVKERSHRRRFAGLIAWTSVGLAMVAGATLAAFTDSEYAAFGDGNTPLNPAAFNIQIHPGKVAATPWHETYLDQSTDPDQGADAEGPIKLTLEGNGLLPGDQAGGYRAAFQVRAQPGSAPAKLTLRFVNDSSAPSAADQALLNALRFDITASPDPAPNDVGNVTSGSTFTGLNANPMLVTNKTQPDTVYTIDVKVWLDGNADNSVRGGSVHLIAVVDGQSVAS